MADKRRNRRSCRYYEMPGKCNHECGNGDCRNAVKCEYFDMLSKEEKTYRKAMTTVGVGCAVSHFKFGSGTISLLEDKYVTVCCFRQVWREEVSVSRRYRNVFDVGVIWFEMSKTKEALSLFCFFI